MIKDKSPLTDYLVIAKEQHQDGGNHHHVYWQCPTIHTSNNERDFDHQGIHPNIEVVNRTPHLVVDYVKKDNNIVHEFGTPPNSGPINENEGWLRIMNESNSVDEFLSTAQKTFPKTCVTSWRNVLSFAEWKYSKKLEAYESPEITVDYDTYPELKEWVEKYVTNNKAHRPKSLILYGDSQLGKTIWARSLGQHAYFPGMFMLDDFNKAAEYAIFDDLIGNFQSLPSYKQWFGQREFIATDKYKGKTRIQWGKPCIFITNDDPRDTATDVDWKWISANAIFVKITTPLCRLVNFEY